MTDEDNLLAQVSHSHCQTEHGSTVKVVPDDNGELFVLFWQSPFMKFVYNCYPTLLCMDSTYKINNRNMPLYSLLAIDGEGKGQVVTYAIVRDESEKALTTVLQLFKDNNEKAEQSLQLVIVDKDYAEINSIRAVFGNAKVLL